MPDWLLCLWLVVGLYICIGHPLLMIAGMEFDDWRKRARCRELDRLHPLPPEKPSAPRLAAGRFSRADGEAIGKACRYRLDGPSRAGAGSPARFLFPAITAAVDSV